MVRGRGRGRVGVGKGVGLGFELRLRTAAFLAFGVGAPLACRQGIGIAAYQPKLRRITIFTRWEAC
jgi:hypothetical protein